MELLPCCVMPRPVCCPLPLSRSSAASAASSASSSCHMSEHSASPSPDVSSFLHHTPGPSCPAHCHSHSWPSPFTSIPSSPTSSTSAHSTRSTASSLSTYSSASSQPASTSIESHFPTYHSIYPASSQPELYDAHTITAIFKRDGFTEIYQWQDGPSTVYDTHTHPTHNAHYIFRGDLHVFYPQLNQSVYYKQGDRFEIPAELVHSTNIGQQGCVYMVASKRPEGRR